MMMMEAIQSNGSLQIKSPDVRNIYEDICKLVILTEQTYLQDTIFTLPIYFFSGMSIGGRLELNPKIASVTKLAGDDKSFFVSCIPHSDIGTVYRLG